MVDPVKVCRGCGETKPATTEFFHRHKLGVGGLNPRCKPCKNADTSASYWSDPDRTRAEKRAVALASYYRHHDANKTKARLLRSVERSSEDERRKHADESKAYYAANAARIAPINRAYRLANADKCAAWRKASKSRRRARMADADGTHSADDIRRQFAKQSGLCHWCSEPLTKYHVDHVIPLARGGSNWPDNIVCSCPRCNLSKGAKMPDEFRRSA